MIVDFKAGLEIVPMIRPCLGPRSSRAHILPVISKKRGQGGKRALRIGYELEQREHERKEIDA